MTHRAAYDLRNDYYDAVQHLPFAFHDRSQTGDLMSRATSDITETERFVGVGLMDLVAIVLLSGGDYYIDGDELQDYVSAVSTNVAVTNLVTTQEM